MKRPRSGPAAPPSNEHELLHELRVHQIELEMQNEKLRSSRLEQELALHRYTELFDFAPTGYIHLRADHVIVAINHAGAELLGQPRHLFDGRYAEQLVAPEWQIILRNLLASVAIDGGRRNSCEMELLRAGGKRFPARLSATLLTRAEPEILLTFEDISEREAREAKLEQTESALREADRRKDEFLAVLSHELRNPLAPIRQSVFVLAHSAPGSDSAQRAQVIIDRQVTHLTRLIDDLLDVTRIARGKVHLQLRQVDLRALVARSIEDEKNSFEVRGVALDDRLGDGPVWVKADPARVVQIASNLLTNSLKFTPRGGHVEVLMQIEGGSCALVVSDSGVGVPPEVLAQIFEPFVQAPQTLDRAGGGLGLGLAMVKGLVELHGGKVRVESAGLGHGTRVTVTWPLAAAPLAEEAPASSLARGPQRRVLVIEDNLDASDTLQIALTLNGHDVRIAHEGRRGIDMAADFLPDVVVCDIGLPGMDGYSVARALRRQHGLENVFLIALSGYAQPEDLQRAQQAGFNCHLAKPASMEALERLMAECGRKMAAPASANPLRAATAREQSVGG